MTTHNYISRAFRIRSLNNVTWKWLHPKEITLSMRAIWNMALAEQLYRKPLTEKFALAIAKNKKQVNSHIRAYQQFMTGTRQMTSQGIKKKKLHRKYIWTILFLSKKKGMGIPFKFLPLRKFLVRSMTSACWIQNKIRGTVFLILFIFS